MAGRACTGSSTRRRAGATRRGRSSSSTWSCSRRWRFRSPSPESSRSSAIARCVRSAGRSSAPSSRTSCSEGSRTTRCRCCCSRSPPVRSRSIAGRRVAVSSWRAPCSSAIGLATLPLALPVLPLHTAVRHGVVKARSDYQSEIGWPAYVRLVERHAAGADVIVTDNYGEAGALDLFGREPATGRLGRGDDALLAAAAWPGGARSWLATPAAPPTSAPATASVARISSANDSDEGGQPIARCTLRGTLAQVWPSIVATQEN